jgi:hypothetical protein
MVNELGRHVFMTSPEFRGLFNSLFDQMTVRRHLGCVIKERWIRGGVLRPMLLDCIDISSIGYDDGVLL